MTTIEAPSQLARLPLRAHLVGDDALLALGARYPNTLAIELTNVSVADDVVFDATPDRSTQLVLSLDAQPPDQRWDWALGTSSEVAAIVAHVDRGPWRAALNQQGARPEWIFTPTTTVVLPPGHSMRLELTDVTSSLPPGPTEVGVRCVGAPGFDDRELAITVRKTDRCIVDAPISGGGTIGWGGPGGHLRWSAPFVVHADGTSSRFGLRDTVVAAPAGGIAARHVHDGRDRPLTREGLVLHDREALFAVHDGGLGATELSLRILADATDRAAAGNWRLIAAADGAGGALRLGTGMMLGPRTSASLGDPIPLGTIMMWSGRPDEIPSGWTLCDGTRGTPDLRDRFVVGAGSDYGVGATGGADAVTLAVTELPSHTHGARSSGAGDHYHWSEGINASGLSMRRRYHWGDTTVDMGHGGGRGGDPNNEMWRGRVNTSNSGNHAHGITVDAAGGGQPHENRPPYFALAFIMRI